MAKKKKVKITQIKSRIGNKPKMVATLDALGLRKIGQSVEHVETEQLKGMIRVIRHLVLVENI